MAINIIAKKAAEALFGTKKPTPLPKPTYSLSLSKTPITPEPMMAKTSTAATAPAKSMTFGVGQGLSNVTEVKPGPRIATQEAIKRGEEIQVTPTPTKTSQVTAAKQEIQKQINLAQQEQQKNLPTRILEGALEVAKKYGTAYATGGIPNVAAQLGSEHSQEIADFARTVAQAAPRLTAGLALSATGQEKEVTPQGAFQQLILGKEPIKSMGMEAKEAGQYGATIAEKINPELKGKTDIWSTIQTMPSVGAAALLFGGIKALDADLGIGAAEKKLGKEALEKVGKEILEKVAQEGGEAVVKKIGETSLLPKTFDEFMQLRKGEYETKLREISPGQPENWYKAQTEAQPLFRDEKFKPQLEAEYAEAQKLPTTPGLVTPPTQAMKVQQTVPKQKLTTVKIPPPSTPIGTVAKEALPPGTKERGFITTVKKTELTAPEVKAEVKGTYEQIHNKETLAKAQAEVERDLNGAKDKVQAVIDSPTLAPDADSFATAQVLMKKYQDEGDFASAIALAEGVAKKATSSGQAIQALSMWGRLTPEGALKYAAKVIKQANEGRAITKRLKLSEQAAKEITELATIIQGLPMGRERDIAIAKMLDKIAEQVPASLAKKVATLQTMAMLLNPKTIIRNVVGNTMFMGVENMADMIGVAIDKPLSWALRKPRSLMMPSVGTQLKGLRKGWKLGLEDAIKGIDTAQMGGKFDIPTGRVFRGKVLGGAEKVLNVALRATDRAAYQAAYDGEIYNLKRILKTNAITEQMHEIAHYQALRRTFQDPNFISKGLSSFKKVLNGGKEFGAGDMIIKYPRTPGALLRRGIEYSPLGFIESAFKLVEPLLGGRVGKGVFDQRKFVDATSRATLGSGVIALGYVLYKNGIMTGKKDENTTLATMERDTGQGEYRINLSALKRWVMGGFNDEDAKKKDGDVVMTYDWNQPMAIPLAIGTNIGEKGMTGGIASNALGSATAMADTLVEQPLFTGIKKTINALAYGGALGTAVENTLKDVPASFVPTFVNQMRALTDNTSRNTYDPSAWKQAWNNVKYRIPGLAQTLPATSKPFGGEQQSYKEGPFGSNKWWNIFFNPAFVTEIKSDPRITMVTDLYGATGETGVLPRFMSKKQEYLGQNFQLNAKQFSRVQNYVSSASGKVMDKLASSEAFKSGTDTQKTKYIADRFSDIAKKAKQMAYAQYMGIDIDKYDQAGVMALLSDLESDKTFKKLPLEQQKAGLPKYLERAKTR